MTITLVACTLRSEVSIATTIDAPIMSRSLFPGVQFWTINEVQGETFLCRLADARTSFERALGLSRLEPERRFLERRLAELDGARG